MPLDTASHSATLRVRMSPTDSHSCDARTASTGRLNLPKSIPVIRRSGWLALGLVLTALLATSRAAVADARFVQDRFAVGLWVDPPADQQTDARYTVNPQTGQELPVKDDSPDMPGLQVSLDAGEGRLFLLPAPSK